MTFKRFFLFTIISVFLACSNTKYEYIVKDDLFRTTVKTGNFIELKKGFTYYDIDNITFRFY